jgi:hypothetical protein
VQIRRISPEEGREYIRHARHETIKAVGGEIRPEMLEPSSFGTYLFAYLPGEPGPIGMAESAFHSQVYRSYDDGPYASLCDMNQFCAFERMAGMRTIYVEPEHRVRRPVFLHLVLASALVFRSMGVQYATVSTNAADTRLKALYQKLGGRLIGDISLDGVYDSRTSVLVFGLDHLLAHRVIDRVRRELVGEAV